MSLKIVKQVLRDAWQALKLNFLSSRRDRYGHIDQSTTVMQPSFNTNKKNCFFYEHTNIGAYSKILTREGKFYLGKYSGASVGLTVITDNHRFFEVGDYRGKPDWVSNQIPEDVVVDDYCWIGANVTLCPGTHIGRGCLVAAGSVCVKNREYPPYTVIGGNPAKIIKYRFTVEQQLEHEKKIVATADRIDEHILREKYVKFNPHK